MNQAKWWNVAFEKEDCEITRSSFYMHVLAWQLIDQGLKRVTIDYGFNWVKMFCGSKKLEEIVFKEARIISWSLNLKGENNNGKERFIGDRERKDNLA